MLTNNNIDDFILYTQLFCPVSGSLIDPDREIYEISLHRLNTNELVIRLKNASSDEKIIIIKLVD